MSLEPGALLEKDPHAELPYVMDWTAWLGVAAAIAVSDWIITGPDSSLANEADEIVDGNLTTQVFLAGGTVGKLYTVTNRITTNETPTRVDDRSFMLRIRER